MDNQIEIDHSLSIIEDISKLFLNESMSDVVFIVDGKQIFAHKIILSARSDILKNMLFSQTALINSKREIHIRGKSSLCFKNFIKYVYTGRIGLENADETQKQELLALGLEYGMKELVESILDVGPELPTQRTITNANNDSFKNSSDKSGFANKQIINKEVADKQIADKLKEVKSPLRFEDIANNTNNGNNGSAVIEGINPERLFSGKKDFDERYLTKHKIERTTKGIIIKLKIPVIINLVKFRLYDIDVKRVYSYLVQVSTDCLKWDTVVDCRQYSCRSWQSIFFDQRLVQFVRILGTKSNEKSIFSSNRYLTLISFFCGLTQRPPKLVNGFWEPETNISSLSKGAIVIINGNDFCRSAKMINDYIEFEYKKYNHIYSEFQFNADSELIVQLPQPIVTSTISFYIDGEERFKYMVKVSVDHIDKPNIRWLIVADNRKAFNASKWQNISFPKCKVLLINICNIRCLDESIHIFPIMSIMCPKN